MRVGLLTSWLSHRGGGLSEVVRALARDLVKLGCDVRLFGLAESGAVNPDANWVGLDMRSAVARRPFSFGFAPRLADMLGDAQLDLIHAHGLWMYPSLVSLRWGRRHQRPWLVSPHGMLDPWAVRRSAWKKKIAGALFEGAHLRGAACLHALTQAEAQAIRTFGLRNPVCIIPNGVELPCEQQVEEPSAGTKTVLYLGRLTPKKGLQELLRGWAAAREEAEKTGWRLVLAGWGEKKYEDKLRRLAAELGLVESVDFVGPAFGNAKDQAFRSAHAFVLPSFSEGLPMAVLEAWSYALPVLMTRECNLPDGFSAKAAVEIAPAPAAIAGGLQQLFAVTETERRTMGLAGRRLVEDRYTWSRVAAGMRDVYAWLLGGGAPPCCVLASPRM